MEDFVVVLKSLGTKITLSAGTLVALIAGLFTINRKLDERIDARSEWVVVDQVITQHERCRIERDQRIEDYFNNNPRLALMETHIENINKNVDIILNLHLNGGGKR